MNDSGLSGTLYPLHLKPKDDELLSSWIVRLSLAHGLTPTEFASLFRLPRSGPIWCLKDIDLNIRTTTFTPVTSLTKLLDALSQQTATPLERVQGMTLDEYEGRLYHKMFSGRTYSWVIPHDFRSNPKIMRFGMQACLQCLAEDKKPYYRRVWRLAFVVACPRHKSRLIDRCPACGEAIHFQWSATYLVHVPERAMTTCYKCWFDFRNALSGESKLWTRTPAESEVISFQEYLVRAAKTDNIRIKRAGSASTKSYFRVLHWVLSVVTQPHAIFNELRCAISKVYGLNLNGFHQGRSCNPEEFDVARRYKLMHLLHLLLQDHPLKYLRFIDRKDLLRRVWWDTWQNADFWYAGVMFAERRRHRSTGSYQRTKTPDSDLYTYSDKQRRWYLNVKYINEFRQAAAQLFLAGLPKRKIGYLLGVSQAEACAWIAEHPTSSVAAREAGKRGVIKA